MNEFKTRLNLADFNSNQLFRNLTNAFTIYCGFLSLDGRVELAREGKALLKHIMRIIDSSVSSCYDFSTDLQKLKESVQSKVTSYNQKDLFTALEGLDRVKSLLDCIPDYDGTPVSFVRDKVSADNVSVTLSNEDTLLDVSPSVLERSFSYFCIKAGKHSPVSLDGFLVNYDYDFRLSFNGEKFCMDFVRKKLSGFRGTLEQYVINGVYLVDITLPVKR